MPKKKKKLQLSKEDEEIRQRHRVVVKGSAEMSPEQRNKLMKAVADLIEKK